MGGFRGSDAWVADAALAAAADDDGGVMLSLLWTAAMCSVHWWCQGQGYIHQISGALQKTVVLLFMDQLMPPDCPKVKRAKNTREPCSPAQPSL